MVNRKTKERAIHRYTNVSQRLVLLNNRTYFYVPDNIYDKFKLYVVFKYVRSDFG